MKKKPFMMALGVFGAIFVFFAALMVLMPSAGKGTPFIGERVGVVEVRGVIVSAQKVIDELESFRENAAIKAIVLRVESPGGGVAPSQEIYTAVKKTVSDKPVVVSMGSVAASGGYYISAPAKRIFANPGTITGSIGVILEFPNLQELMKTIGVGLQVVKSGAFKDMGASNKALSAEERKLLQETVDNVHSQFVRAVAEGRSMPEEKVRALADGRVFSGEQAKAVGLVDQLGGLQDAVEYAGQLGKISGKPKVVYPPKEQTGLLEYILGKSKLQLAEILPANGGLSFIWRQ
ncbi:MAG: signal peptide peptidase SppA [Deltaproteobacteria bacterium]|nr:signal peptide peptidase SppA [Deltaproteobacteria bacterium]